MSATRLNNSELNTLSHCNLNTHIIAIDTHAEGGSQIVTLAKSDITCWQLFLRLFNAGTLAKYQIHLTDVTKHLSQYNWSSLGRTGNSDVQQAYRQVCILANKGLYSKYSETLLDSVALDVVRKDIECNQFCDGRSLNRMMINHSIHWNPLMQTKHIKALLHNHYPASSVRIEDQNLHEHSSDSNVSLDMLNSARISIRQDMPTQIRFVPVPVPVPAPQPRTRPPRT